MVSQTLRLCNGSQFNQTKTKAHLRRDQPLSACQPTASDRVWFARRDESLAACQPRPWHRTGSDLLTVTVGTVPGADR